MKYENKKGTSAREKRKEKGKKRFNKNKAQ